jgi:glutamate dehydrogenase/leucine dehydrogenase
VGDPEGAPGDFEHEQLTVIRGSRTGITIIVAVHSTVLGSAIGGCRLRCYPSWQDGLADALRLSAAMTDKCGR